MDAVAAELEADGCERIFEDTISAAKSKRSGLDAALDYLRPGVSAAVGTYYCSLRLFGLSTVVINGSVQHGAHGPDLSAESRL